MFIVNPMNALQARGRGGVTNLFRTHPPTEARVERLRAIASELRGERGPIGDLTATDYRRSRRRPGYAVRSWQNSPNASM